MRGLAALLATALSVALLPSPAPAELVDHIVAAVNNEVITASDLAQAVSLNRRFGDAATDGDALERETLDGLIARRLLAQEARRLRFVEVTERELGDEVERFTSRFGSGDAAREFLIALDLTERELARMLGERLLVQKFIEKKVGLFVRVTREETRSFFETHADRFPGKSFHDVQKAVEELLTEQKVEQQLTRYIAELRGKAALRINR
jgi:hypothetical protein